MMSLLDAMEISPGVVYLQKSPETDQGYTDEVRPVVAMVKNVYVWPLMSTVTQ